MAVKKLKRKPKRIRSATTLSQFASIAAIVAAGALTLNALKPSAQTQEPTSAPIVVAANDVISLPAPQRAIKPGEKISTIAFTQVELPKGTNTAHYVDNLQNYSGAYAKTALPKMLPIPREALSFENLDNNNMVVEGIPDGMRAITVSVDSEAAVEGWARSGSYVDVILVRNTLDAKPDLESKVIAENVRILSAGQSTAPSGTRTTAAKAPTTVTLLTSQEEALKIKTASGLGKITFALRGYGDQSPSSVVAMNQRNLLGNNSPQQPARYTGYARDPQGRVFVLTSEKQWIRSKEKEVTASATYSVSESSDTRARLDPSATSLVE
jgi:pilus assembly protein CpaB